MGRKQEPVRGLEAPERSQAVRYFLFPLPLGEQEVVKPPSLQGYLVVHMCRPVTVRRALLRGKKVAEVWDALELE